ncbi:aminoglycoside phosphotransferase family protein [Pseudonocardia sp. ICBG601]|uniref:aminoglycoside phosphotransferase family protein n=1 Tax=Pseudonocardia sp. ICBG601 TaxID=2846759 RepID=UPI001CF69F6B|nr:aminoglycoside phosphotransferase family protein [Pseudonocardia sp. ICBG601]
MADLATGAPSSFTEPLARRVLAKAVDRADLPRGPVELIRIGSNAVFRIAGNLIARVASPSAPLATAEKQIRVARWLAAERFPATRAVDVEQPVEVDGCAVTFWESVAPGTTYAPISDVAAVIRRLHQLPTPDGLDLPEIEPFGPAGADLPDFPGLAPDDACFLRERIEWAREAFPRLPFELPYGAIHGDANVGNVLVDTAGHPVLIDLDSFATGPREWDLIQTALFATRLGWHSRSEYADFVRAYGYDVTQWSGFECLADMREIAMTSWLSKKATESQATAREAGRRISDIRNGAPRTDWGAY